MLENVQHKFTSRIREYQTWDDEQNMYTCTVDYWDRLKDLRTYSLEGEAKGTVLHLVRIHGHHRAGKLPVIRCLCGEGHQAEAEV